jgi:uncharacterized membrane protein
MTIIGNTSHCYPTTLAWKTSYESKVSCEDSRVRRASSVAPWILAISAVRSVVQLRFAAGLLHSRFAFPILMIVVFLCSVGVAWRDGVHFTDVENEDFDGRVGAVVAKLRQRGDEADAPALVVQARRKVTWLS